MMKNHFFWVMLLLDAYALFCFCLLLMLLAEAAAPELVVFRGFSH